MMNGWYGYGYGPMFGIFGGVMMVLWWALIITAIIALIRWVRWNAPGSPGHRGHRGSAREILEERFAKGEIDEKEFERRKKVLEG